jgi:hypothetical protein
MGLLGLQQLVYLAEVHPERMQRLLKLQEQRFVSPGGSYPVAVAGINVTFMLYHEFFFAPKAPYRALVYALCAIDRHAFDELFCDSLESFEALWQAANARYMDFPAVLARLRQVMRDVLVQVGPFPDLPRLRALLATSARQPALAAASLAGELSSLLTHTGLVGAFTPLFYKLSFVLQKATFAAQTEAHEALQQSNRILSDHLAQSGAVFAALRPTIERQTRLLQQMRQQLDDSFRRIRALKRMLQVEGV